MIANKVQVRRSNMALAFSDFISLIAMGQAWGRSGKGSSAPTANATGLNSLII